jgi:hypothetical protein
MTEREWWLLGVGLVTGWTVAMLVMIAVQDGYRRHR